MCIICVEYSAGKMTVAEALRAFAEVVPKDEEEEKHVKETSEDIWIEDWLQNTTQTE